MWQLHFRRNAALWLAEKHFQRSITKNFKKRSKTKIYFNLLLFKRHLQIVLSVKVAIQGYFLFCFTKRVANMLSNDDFLVCFKYKCHIINFLLTSLARSVLYSIVKYQTSVVLYKPRPLKSKHWEFPIYCTNQWTMRNYARRRAWVSSAIRFLF